MIICKTSKFLTYIFSLSFCFSLNAQQWFKSSGEISSVYHMGKVGIGISSPTNALHVIGQVQMGHTNSSAINDFYGGTFKSFYTFTGGDSYTNPFENQGSAILGQITYGDKNSAPIGTIHGISSKIDVVNCGDARSEMAGMFIQLRSEVPSRLWGVDLGVMGPVDTQADLLTGIVNAVNSYNRNKPVSGAFGSVVISKPDAGAGHRIKTATFSLDAGLAIVGYSNTKELPKSAFDRALQVGGWATWMKNNERSSFLTGVDVSDYIERGIYIHKPQSGGKGYALIIDQNAGNVGLGTNNPTSKVDIEGPGESQLRLRNRFTPVNSNDTRGNEGDIAWDDEYLYLKTSTGWKRTELTTF